MFVEPADVASWFASYKQELSSMPRWPNNITLSYSRSVRSSFI